MDKESQKNFQQRPKWVFITLIIILIGASPAFSELILDFFPQFNHYRGWIKLFFIIIGFIILFSVYWIEKQKYRDPDKISRDEYNKISRDEDMKKTYRQYRWIVWKQRILKDYPLEIITLRFFPWLICWIISWFIDKNYKKNYQLDSFYFPKDWTAYNYEEITKRFFKSMCRVHFLKEQGVVSYEVKFERDFQNIEIRWTEEGNSSFGELKNGSYKQFFSEESLKHVKIFTWIFPFGLYWNLIRIIKNLWKIIKSIFKRRKN